MEFFLTHTSLTDSSEDSTQPPRKRHRSGSSTDHPICDPHSWLDCPVEPNFDDELSSLPTDYSSDEFSTVYDGDDEDEGDSDNIQVDDFVSDDDSYMSEYQPTDTESFDHLPSDSSFVAYNSEDTYMSEYEPTDIDLTEDYVASSGPGSDTFSNDMYDELINQDLSDSEVEYLLRIQSQRDIFFALLTFVFTISLLLTRPH